MLPTLLFLTIVAPVLAALACLLLPVGAVRRLVVLATAAVLTVSSVLLFAGGPFTYDPPAGVGSLVTLLDFVLLLVMLFYAFKYKHSLIKFLVLAQLVPLAVFELFVVEHGAHYPAIVADSLSLLMVLVVSIVGSLICVFGLPYMDEHEHHLHLTTSKQPRFFFFMVLFLGAMNGMVLSNDLGWIYFFFEVTTFCSFMLIGHDGTEIAIANSLRALWMNSLGGVAFMLGIFMAYRATGGMDLQAILHMGPAHGALLLGVALLCLAGMVKAAQMPFQSWLLGAMVAPTPVSALLHSSTMVKAGVYLVLRMAPAFQNTFLSDCVALVGAFTFFATAALAMGQRNGKKILAYSTVGNLGLIICCAGINTPEALAAGILLILFHAVSKGLLFLAVGTIEQGIGSRDIEDMRGLSGVMPTTALITVIGVSTMVLPPFGVLLSKWLAIEAASSFIVVVVLLALGSALSVVYWGRWAGILMSSQKGGSGRPEPLALLTVTPLRVLAAAAVLLSVFTPWLYARIVKPMLTVSSISVNYGTLSTSSGAFALYPLFFFLLLGVALAWAMSCRAAQCRVSTPYLAGLDTPTSRTDMTFNGPMNKPASYGSGNYYIEDLFGEGLLTPWVNSAALALILLLIGGAL